MMGGRVPPLSIGRVEIRTREAGQSDVFWDLPDPDWIRAWLDMTDGNVGALWGSIRPSSYVQAVATRRSLG